MHRTVANDVRIRLALGASVALSACLAPKFTEVDSFDESGGTAGATTKGGAKSTSNGGTQNDTSSGGIPTSNGGTGNSSATGGKAATAGASGSTSLGGTGSAGLGATGGSAGTAFGGASSGGTTASGGASSVGGALAAGGIAAGGSSGGGSAGRSAAGGSMAGASARGGSGTGGAASGGASVAGAGAGGLGAGGSASGGAGTGGATSWCATQTIPTGVATSDYQCVDFDSGLPPAATWVQNVKNSGTLSTTTNRYSSSPNSLLTVVPATTSYNTVPFATLSWQGVGGTPLTGVSISANLSPITVGGVSTAWTNGVSLLCISFGSGSACLNYTYSNTSLGLSGNPYTGYYIAGKNSAVGVLVYNCPLTATLTENIWTRVELRLTYTTSWSIQVFFGTTEVGNCGGTFGADTVGTATVGETSPVGAGSSTMYYDNVVAWVTR